MGSPPNATQFCIRWPIDINSGGIVNSNILEFPLPVLLLQVLVIFIITEVFHYLLRNIGQTRFTSQLLAGLVLGPTVLGKHSEVLFPHGSEIIVSIVGIFSFTIYTFLQGVKMDMSMIFRTGKKPFFIGFLTVLAPLLLSLAILEIIISSWKLKDQEKLELIAITFTHCLTPFASVSYLLSSLKILTSELGRLGLSSAIITDQLSLVALALFNFFVTAFNTSVYLAIQDVVGLVIFIGFSIFVVRPMMFSIIRRTSEGASVKNFYVYSLVLLLLVGGMFTHILGISALFGPYILGLVVPAGPPLGSTLEDQLNTLSNELFLPIYVTTCTLRTNISLINFSRISVSGATIIMVSIILGKFTASLIPPLFCKLPVSDALTLGCMLNFKSVIDLAILTTFRDFEVVNEDVYDLSIIGILLSSSITPILVKFFYDPSRKYAGYQKRNVMHSDPNSHLRILACIYQTGNCTPIINLLEAASPTKEKKIAIYMLHVMKLIGRSSPIFISHKLHKRRVSDWSYSADIIFAFNRYQRNNWEAITIEAFTAISPPKFIHEDICLLALDNLTAIMILPFHRKWSKDGTVEFEDSSTRTINCSVIERSPCSVAILIDRGNELSAINNVAMLFIGGKDDREALVFAQRMVNHKTIRLTLIRFLPVDEGEITDWDKMLDSEVVKNFKYSCKVSDGNVGYEEKFVKDGPHTDSIIRSMVADFDIFIVGRRQGNESPQTSGLNEWLEFPELGIIGDMLASANLKSRHSVLVVQHQQQIT